MIKIEINSIGDLDNAAGDFTSRLKDYRKFSIYGEMGVGKTTLIRAICKELGVNDYVTSPSFTIINQYKRDNQEWLYHMDFYRLNSVEEVHQLGLEDYLWDDNYCFIEWPEKIDDVIPKHFVSVKMVFVSKKERIIEINL